ncbi:MAG: hypothetical protein U0V03_00280 [Bacteroidia bacterium]
MKRILLLINFSFFLFSFSIKSQTKDTIYLMNGNIIGENIIDTLLGAVTINDPAKPEKKLHYELEDIYMVLFSNGIKRYYYQQDSAKNNWFTREEMWYYTKGERDARKGFKPLGSMIGCGIAGFIGGASGTFFGPAAPFAYFAMVGLPKVKVKSKTVSNPMYVEYDSYVLGYERVARTKRRTHSVVTGAIGLALGYAFYGIAHKSYPETINIGFLKR